jgi:nucleoside-diphosphate-sugar epimerase
MTHQKRQKSASMIDDENKTVLVTGGAGYVGSVLLRRLLQQGFRVICVDCLRYGGRSLLEIWDHPNLGFYNVDITKPQDIENIFKRNSFDGIVHLAAIVGDPACKLEPELARKTNLEASINLVELAQKYHVPRLVFASTCSNYGKMKDSNGYVDETSPLNPVSLYAELKVAFENYLINQPNRVPDFYPTVLRFSTVYGMSPRMRFDLTVNEFTKEVALGRELTVYGENYWRPYCHVGDFSRAILAVLTAPLEKVAYNVFNVGDTTQNYTKKMIIDELLKLSPDTRVKYVHVGEDPRDYRVIFDKIHNVLGFQISKTVPEGINDVLSCIRMRIIENPDDQRYYNIPISR